MGYIRPYPSNVNLSNFIPGTIDIDGTLSADSDNKIPTQKAVKTKIDNKIKISSYTAVADNTTSFSLGLAYDSAHDNLELRYAGVLLDSTNFTITTGTINLSGWSISTGEVINIKVEYNVM